MSEAELRELLARCVGPLEDLYLREIAIRDGYVGYRSRWERYNADVVAAGELLADVRAATEVSDAQR